MPLDTNATLTAVGIIIVFAFIAILVFQRFHVPDIFFLLGLGVLLGPVFGFVDVQGFREFLPFLGTLAVIIILFDGGLEIRLRQVRASLASGGLMALAVLVLTSYLGAFIGMRYAGLPLAHAVILGMIFGGAGVVIVIPLIQRMGVDKRAESIVTMEAVVSDVLVILGVFALSAAIALRQTNPASFAFDFAKTFLLGLLLGAILGYLWTKILVLHEGEAYEYIVTLAVLFLLYAATDALGGSGPVAVLVFGIVVGNTKVGTPSTKGGSDEFGLMSPTLTSMVPVFGSNLVHFHQEIVFFIRAFFFVTLGIVLDPLIFRDPNFLLVGILMTLAVILARAVATWLVLAKTGLTAFDKLSIALMFPIGLIAAALSVIPFQRFGIAGTEHFPDYAAIVIVLTNLVATALVFLASLPAVRSRLDRRAAASA